MSDTVRDELIRLGAQASKDRDARNVAQVVACAVDAALAYLAGLRVDVEAVAGVLKEHDAGIMSCADHDRYCCPAGDAHDFRSPYRHQAEQIAALTPDVSNPADAVLPYDGPDFDLVMAGHDLSLVPHWPGPGKWCEACPAPVPATPDALPARAALTKETTT